MTASLTKRGRQRRQEEKPANIAALRAGRGTPTTSRALAMTVSPDKPLTEKQKIFARCWAEGDTPANAYLRAGYSPENVSYAYRMIRMPNIIALYEAEKRKYEEAAQMTRKKVMDMHLEAYEMAKLMSEPATMVSAAREIGRMCGYYEPVKVKVNLQVSAEMQRMNSLTDEELLAMIKGQGVPALTNDADEAEDFDDQGL